MFPYALVSPVKAPTNVELYTHVPRAGQRIFVVERSSSAVWRGMPLSTCAMNGSSGILLCPFESGYSRVKKVNSACMLFTSIQSGFHMSRRTPASTTDFEGRALISEQRCECLQWLRCSRLCCIFCESHLASLLLHIWRGYCVSMEVLARTSVQVRLGNVGRLWMA
jgi:hypothetical protein